MVTWLEQFFKLITSETGSLTYHLVLSFSIAGALALNVNSSNQERPAWRKRERLALACLLTLQIALFLLASLTWQGLLQGERLLPPLDRLASLLALVLIFWLWCWPEPSPIGDVLTALVFLLLILAGTFSSLWWLNQSGEGSFNGTLSDTAAASVALGLLTAGLLYLIYKRPLGYLYGLAMGFALAAGWALHLATFTNSGDFPAAARLGQMIAYPFLLLLPHRYATLALNIKTIGKETDVLQAKTDAGFRQTHPAEIVVALEQISTLEGPLEIMRSTVRHMAHLAEADYCLWFAPAAQDGEIQVAVGYDRAQGRWLESKTFPKTHLPLVMSAQRGGRARRQTSASTSIDRGTLATAYGFEPQGTLLVLPLPLSEEESQGQSLVLLSPRSRRDWSQEEQENLLRIGRTLAHFLHHQQEVHHLRQEVINFRQQALSAQDLARQMGEENQDLKGQLAVLQENLAQYSARLAQLNHLATAYERVKHQLEVLSHEHERLVEESQRQMQKQREALIAREGELRLALQELAHLEQALRQAEETISALKLAPAAVPQAEGILPAIEAIAQEARQSLTSISGYTNVLLSESLGILSNRQRKFVERIRASTDRLGHLMNELARLATPSGAQRLDFTEVDVCSLIRQSVAETDLLYHQKNLVWQVNLPSDGLSLQSDRHALQRALTLLLHNAASATPPGAEVRVNAQVKTRPGDQDFLLIEVGDSGEGIPPSDLSRVFAPRSPEVIIPGLGDPTIDLAGVKQLVEALGGRTWVDSERGKGSTFSMILPLSPTPSSPLWTTASTQEESR